ncbi:hypothetical protein JOQ06_007925 [Pogonophryne albipinna]|uniref:Uncharacterized protein n=1 Tax=Pogonophryne albipinna TaxID=1090488 RepID=A0AAD6A9K3_9TELE|nr:hypothetical protein JOQ06_007925 [Pogonophryne albipinna]
MNYQQHLANSAAIRSEIQRFESVHPNIYSIYELLERVEEPLLQNQIREHVIAIEGKKRPTKCPNPGSSITAVFMVCFIRYITPSLLASLSPLFALLHVLHHYELKHDSALSAVEACHCIVGNYETTEREDIERRVMEEESNKERRQVHEKRSQGEEMNRGDIESNRRKKQGEETRT